MADFIDKLQGSGILLSNPQLQILLDRRDLTYGYARYLDMFAIKKTAHIINSLWRLTAKFFALYQIPLKKEYKDVKEFVEDFLAQIQARSPSLAKLYEDELIDLYIQVKYLRSREGYEREALITKKELSISEGEKGEEKLREGIIKRKVIKGEV